MDFDRDSSDESDIEESSDSLRPIEMFTVALPRFLLLFSLASCFSLFSSVHIFLRLPILLDQLQEKPSYRKHLSVSSALRNTRVYWRFVHKFHQDVNVSKLSLH